MLSTFRAARWLPFGVTLTAAVLFSCGSLSADEMKGVQRYDPADGTVELFFGIEQGRLEARLIVKDSTECRVFITNKSDQPLNVSMPAALAGVPVLAQFLGPNLDGFDRNNGAQGVGIGNQFGVDRGNNVGGQPFVNPGGGGNPMFAPFNIPPEKVAILRLRAVCLEHGKPDPRPRMEYELKPIDSLTDNREVVALCQLLGRSEVTQRAAQAAAWHLQNGMSWEELVALQAKIALGRYSRPFFTRAEITQARHAAEHATQLAQRVSKCGKTQSLARR
jgi:hypothetical protein